MSSIREVDKDTRRRMGFTGTQGGMTVFQAASFGRIVTQLNPKHFHHGDCIGADAEAHQIVTNIGGIRISIHPPLSNKKRARCRGHWTFDPMEYLARNKVIVEMTGVLVATPKTNFEELRSGTWSTIRYARNMKRSILIICRSGVVVRENI